MILPGLAPDIPHRFASKLKTLTLPTVRVFLYDQRICNVGPPISPNAYRSHRTKAITATTLTISLKLGSIGNIRLTRYSRTPIIIITTNIVMIDVPMVLHFVYLHEYRAKRKSPLSRPYWRGFHYTSKTIFCLTFFAGTHFQGRIVFLYQ